VVQDPAPPGQCSCQVRLLPGGRAGSNADVGAIAAAQAIARPPGPPLVPDHALPKIEGPGGFGGTLRPFQGQPRSGWLSSRHSSLIKGVYNYEVARP
jgi:hypothetical protein